MIIKILIFVVLAAIVLSLFTGLGFLVRGDQSKGMVNALTVRIVLFTVFPAAFAAFVPAEVVRHPSGGGVLLMLAAALVYSALAVAIFDRGLRRYRSGNGWLELR